MWSLSVWILVCGLDTHSNVGIHNTVHWEHSLSIQQLLCMHTWKSLPMHSLLWFVSDSMIWRSIDYGVKMFMLYNFFKYSHAIIIGKKYTCKHTGIAAERSKVWGYRAVLFPASHPILNYAHPTYICTLKESSLLSPCSSSHLKLYHQLLWNIQQHKL